MSSSTTTYFMRSACVLAMAAALSCACILSRVHAAGAIAAVSQRACDGASLLAFESSAAIASLSTANGMQSAALFRGSVDAASSSGTFTRSALALDAVDAAQTLAPSEEWDAGAILGGTDFRTRHIYTAIDMPGIALQTVSFSWPALVAGQRAALEIGVNGQPDGLGAQRLDYLRGDRSREIGRPGGIFRRRSAPLGDIVHSLPVVVGAPGGSSADPQYRQFYDSYKTRAPAVYVGANDGMLHAFRAADGVELFAYIPAVLFDRLPLLTRPDYVHQAYVDGPISVGEARVAGRWRTVLAAGMGDGANGVFALDVSDPEHFTGGDGALLEFGDADDADMGFQLGVPALARLRDADGVLRDFLVVAGGYRHSVQASAASALFLLSLDKRPSDAWRLGANYFKFPVPRSPVAAAALNGLNAGLSAPTLVPGDDGVLRYAYAGDLQGNVWRFDLAGRAPWPKAAPSAPLFIARDGDGKRQPITQQPQVVYADAIEDGYMILFGTGKLLDEGDLQRINFSTQSFYGVLDSLQAPQSYKRGDLQARTLKPQGAAFAVAGPILKIGSGGRNHGWYLDFPDAEQNGERSVSSALLVGRTLLFNTISFDSACAAASRTYVLSTLSGLTTDEPSAAKDLPAPLTGIAGEGAARLLLLRSATVGQPGAAHGARSLLLNASAKQIGLMPAPGEADVQRIGRFEWREILNWQERRAAALK